MYIFKILLFSSVCALLGCSNKEAPHLIAAQNVMDKFEKSISSTPLALYGKGGAMMKDIQSFSYDFVLCANTDIDQSRKIIIETIENFIQIVNNDKDIRPFLKNFPFSEKSLYLAINFVKKDNLDVDPPYINFVQNAHENDVLNFFRNDNQFKPFYSEPYSEAYEKVYGIPLPDRMSQIKD